MVLVYNEFCKHFVYYYAIKGTVNFNYSTKSIQQIYLIKKSFKFIKVQFFIYLKLQFFIFK